MADIDNAIDELYQGPLDAFIDARNALAKAAKRADVKAFAKPTLPAWAVNQLFWHHRELVQRLEDASIAVRQAHERALAGQKADIAAAEQAHREALREASATAKDVLTAGGHALTPGTLDAIRDTLQALPAEDANGRLTKPLTARGLDALAGLTLAARPQPIPARAATPPAPPPPRAVPPAKATAKKGAAPVDPAVAARAAREAEKAARERQAMREKAEAALATARAALDDANTAVDQAERELEKRQAERVTAREHVKKAQRAVEELSFGR